MKTQPVIDGSFAGLLGVTSQTGTWAVSGSTGIVNNSANGVTAMVGASSGISSSPMTAEATFAIQDGAGLFTNATGLNLTTGFQFEISYVGSDTLLTLRSSNTSSSFLSTGVASIAEIPCPFARGSVQTIRMSPGQRGWIVHYKSGSNWLKLMDVSTTSPPSWFGFLGSMTAGNSYSGVYAKKNGVIFDLVKMNRVGLQFNNGPGTRVLFSDHFISPDAQTQYNTANASTPGDTSLVIPAGSPAATYTQYSTYLKPQNAAPGVTIVSANKTTPTGMLGSDHPFQMICLDYQSGPGAIKLQIGGVMKNIYFNSDISGAGVKAITIESGAS